MDLKMMNYDKLTGIDEFNTCFKKELELHMFDYKNINGVDHSYLACKTLEDFQMYYASKYPEFGLDLTNFMAQFDFKKPSRQEIKGNKKKLLKLEKKLKQQKLEEERQLRIKSKLSVIFD